MGQMPPLVDVKNAGLCIDGKTVLSDITLCGNAARVGVVGQNGSGKTSLARLISGLVPATSGTVQIAGVDVATDRHAALGLVGILFQNPDHQIIFPTVAEEIGFGLTQMGRDKTQVATGVAAILDQFGKSHWLDAHVHQLSQGQRQLVCLMAVLVMQPQLIILDEPFAGLDIPTAAHLARVLKGITAHLWQITHDPATLAHYDEVVWMDRGTVRQYGPAAQVLAAYTDAMHQRGLAYDLSDITG